MTQARIDNATPAGGDYSIAYFSDGPAPADGDALEFAEIVEYKYQADGPPIAVKRTYGQMNRRSAMEAAMEAALPALPARRPRRRP